VDGRILKRCDSSLNYGGFLWSLEKCKAICRKSRSCQLWLMDGLIWIKRNKLIMPYYFW